jgi:hypothetical protein
MRILITTPLYPPDIAAPAPYVKELATRLASVHEISVLTFSHLPERVPGVTIIEVDKRKPLLTLLVSFTRALVRILKEVDVVLVENGPAAELPAFFASFFVATPYIVHTGDGLAQKRTERSPLHRLLAALARARAHAVITDVPHARPEILPFELEPTDAFAAYESSWQTHMNILTETLKNI